MRTLCLLAAFAGWAAAQAPPSNPAPALIRGVLLERDPQTASGEFSVRAEDNRVFRYQFDAKTYVERESQLIDVRRLQPGEKVEVLSDAVPGAALRYARTIHVLADPLPARPLSAGRLRAPKSVPDRALPAGNLTYSGVVFRMTNERLVLHTREAGDQSILLRKDTRYLQDGEVVGASDLKPNTRVFIRAGKDLYDEVEAYQVIWGGILNPK